MTAAFRRAAGRLWFGWVLAWNAVTFAAAWPFWMAAMTVRPTARSFWVWCRVWSRAVLAGAGFRVRARGAAPAGPVVYVANHQSMLDIPALALGVGAPFVFVARAELRRLPLVGSVLAASRCVFVDRHAPGGADAALDRAAERLAAGESVLFFPEGTRSYGRALGTFYPGAFRLAERAGVPTVPVAVDGAGRLLHERDRTARPGTVTVRVGAPLPPGLGVEAATARARDAVAALLAGP